MADFENSEASKYLVLSIQFLRAARVLSDAQAAEGRVLFLPTLTLAGQGLELLLKAGKHWNLDPPPTNGKDGHAVRKFWSSAACEPIRLHTYNTAKVERDEAALEGVTLDDGLPSGDLPKLIDEYILCLGKLHEAQPFPLRYPSDENETMAPRSPWLVRVFERTAMDFLRNPSTFRSAD